MAQAVASLYLVTLGCPRHASFLKIVPWKVFVSNLHFYNSESEIPTKNLPYCLTTMFLTTFNGVTLISNFTLLIVPFKSTISWPKCKFS
jgi:hypothetical protein